MTETKVVNFVNYTRAIVAVSGENSIRLRGRSAVHLRHYTLIALHHQAVRNDRWILCNVEYKMLCGGNATRVEDRRRVFIDS